MIREEMRIKKFDVIRLTLSCSKLYDFAIQLLL